MKRNLLRAAVRRSRLRHPRAWAAVSLTDKGRQTRKELFSESLRKARKRFPYPKAWAAISFTRMPRSSIAGPQSALNRPEGLSFTRAGDLLAVGNTEANTVSIFPRKRRGDYSDKPSCMITDPINLNYVHDVAFSPDGEMLAAAAREDHSVPIFKRSKSDRNSFEAVPALILRGDESRVRYPAGLSFHPNGQCLGVANRQTNGITLYRYCPDRGFDAVPFQVISENDLVARGIAAPHDVEFSPDGALLFVIHKQFYKTRDARGTSAITCFRWQTAAARLDPEPIHTSLRGNICLHSISIHPSGRYVAVSDESADVEIFEWDANVSTLKPVDRLSIFRCGHPEGPKGVCFTNDGKQLATATVCDEILCFAGWDQNKQPVFRAKSLEPAN